MDPYLTGLIRRAQSGDVASFAELLDLHYDTIYRFAWKWCCHRTNAEDIAQQSCIKLAGSLAQFRFQAAFTSWLYQLVISCARDWQRAQQRHEHDALPENEPTADAARAEDSIYLEQLLEQLSVLGFGQGNYRDEMAQTLAQNGNGVAAYIDTLSEAKKVLVQESTASLFPIAKDVKLQIEFNPATVAEYRLVGYETRALNREDFNNDKVDAGDVGAGHTVTAIYEITLVSSKAKLIDERRYAGRERTSAAPQSNANEYGFHVLEHGEKHDHLKVTELKRPIELARIALHDCARYGLLEVATPPASTAPTGSDQVPVVGSDACPVRSDPRLRHGRLCDRHPGTSLANTHLAGMPAVLQTRRALRKSIAYAGLV